MKLLARLVSSSSSLRSHVAQSLPRRRTLATEAAILGDLSQERSITPSDAALNSSNPTKPANEVPVGADPRKWRPTPDGPLRPKLAGVPIPRSHPLYAFFRFQETTVEEEEEDGEKKKVHRYYTTLEAPHEENDKSSAEFFIHFQ